MGCSTSTLAAANANTPQNPADSPSATSTAQGADADATVSTNVDEAPSPKKENEVNTAPTAPASAGGGGGGGASAEEVGAATTIQAGFRGYQARKHLKEDPAAAPTAAEAAAGAAPSAPSAPAAAADGSDAKQTLADKLKALFIKADAGSSVGANDGDLSPQELKFNLPRKELAALLRESGRIEDLDTDDDGKVSLEEILDGMDADDDGSVSLDEFLKAALPYIMKRNSTLLHDIAAQAIVDLATETRGDMMAAAVEAAAEENAEAKG